MLYPLYLPNYKTSYRAAVTAALYDDVTIKKVTSV